MIQYNFIIDGLNLSVQPVTSNIKTNKEYKITGWTELIDKLQRDTDKQHWKTKRESVDKNTWYQSFAQKTDFSHRNWKCYLLV